MVLKSRSVRFVGKAACIGDMKNSCKILVGKPEGRQHLKYLDVNGRLIIK
jgi:hypothetical protein